MDVSYLYTDGSGSHFLDQESFETLTLHEDMLGDAMEFLVEGVLLQVRKFNGNPIGLQLPIFVELDVAETEPGIKGDTGSGSVTKTAKLETGLEIRVPPLHQARREGEGGDGDPGVCRPGVTRGLRSGSSSGRPRGYIERNMKNRFRNRSAFSSVCLSG